MFNEERTEDLKADILRVSQDMFQELGYDETTFQKISDVLGITKGAITYHFKNKHLIIGYLIQEYFEELRKYIDSYPKEYKNQYWRFSVMYIFAYRTIMKTEKNRNLFYHKNQMSLWETTKKDTVRLIYQDIAADFHKVFTEEELIMVSLMDLGARRRMYEAFLVGETQLTVDLFAYYHVYLIGFLSKIDEATVKENIRSAFEFADCHNPPVTPIFQARKKTN